MKSYNMNLKEKETLWSISIDFEKIWNWLLFKTVIANTVLIATHSDLRWTDQKLHVYYSQQ